MTPAAYAVLNLDALGENLSKVYEYAPDAKVMAVIKANAYGHGLLRVAQALQKVDALAVARVDEAISLREDGIQKRIAVLEGFTCAEELNALLHYNFDAVIHSEQQIDLLQTRNPDQKISAWLKLDTGMSRLGFKVTDFTNAYQRVSNCNFVNQPVGLMTHLANADKLDDETTKQQVNLFNKAVENYPGERSIANSAGVMGWSESLAEWVRPGIMLFGVTPFSGDCGEQLGLKPVMSLHSRLIAVKQLKQGDVVGYGGEWVCPKPTRLGIIAIGYGDGYPRNVRNGTPVLVNGVRVPIIGKVSMDMITVDLENHPEAKPGAHVTLWGEHLPVEEIARCADTIPYTLLCGITRRVQIVEAYPHDF